MMPLCQSKCAVSRTALMIPSLELRSNNFSTWWSVSLEKSLRKQESSAYLSPEYASSIGLRTAHRRAVPKSPFSNASLRVSTAQRAPMRPK